MFSELGPRSASVVRSKKVVAVTFALALAASTMFGAIRSTEHLSPQESSSNASANGQSIKLTSMSNASSADVRTPTLACGELDMAGGLHCVVFSLGEGCFVAYSLESGCLVRAWRGSLEFQASDQGPTRLVGRGDRFETGGADCWRNALWEAYNPPYGSRIVEVEAFGDRATLTLDLGMGLQVRETVSLVVGKARVERWPHLFENLPADLVESLGVFVREFAVAPDGDGLASCTWNRRVAGVSYLSGVELEWPHTPQSEFDVDVWETLIFRVVQGREAEVLQLVEVS